MAGLRAVGANNEESAADAVARGKAIERRRLRHGIKSLTEFGRATGLSRKAVTAAENGLASEATYRRLETWLDRFEEETGADVPPEPRTETVEFTVEGDFGVKVTVKGPISDHETLRADVAEIIRSIREASPPEQQ